MKSNLLLTLILAAFITGCDKDDVKPVVTDDHIVGATAMNYSETNETNNSTSGNAENTIYTVNEAGIVISGSSESASPTTDFYKFSTGTYGKVDVQVFVNGATETEESHKTTITLDAFETDGYSSLMGSGYFIRAWIQSNKSWVLSIAPPAGASYTIEMKGAE
jgi:hypothetical protein